MDHPLILDQMLIPDYATCRNKLKKVDHSLEHINFKFIDRAHNDFWLVLEDQSPESEIDRAVPFLTLSTPMHKYLLTLLMASRHEGTLPRYRCMWCETESKSINFETATE